MMVHYALAQGTHVNESSYVIKVDASTIGYGNQSGLCILYKVEWTAEVRESCDDPIYSDRVSTTVLNSSSSDDTYQKAKKPKGK